MISTLLTLINSHNTLCLYLIIHLNLYVKMFVFYIKLQTFKHAISIKFYKFIQLKYTNSLNFIQHSLLSFKLIKYGIFIKKSGSPLFVSQRLEILILPYYLNVFNLFFFYNKPHSVNAIV